MTGRIKLAELKQREKVCREKYLSFSLRGIPELFAEMMETRSRSARIRSWWDSVMGNCLWDCACLIASFSLRARRFRPQLIWSPVMRTKLGVRLISRTKLARNILLSKIGLAA